MFDIADRIQNKIITNTNVDEKIDKLYHAKCKDKYYIKIIFNVFSMDSLKDKSVSRCSMNISVFYLFFRQYESFSWTDRRVQNRRNSYSIFLFPLETFECYWRNIEAI